MRGGRRTWLAMFAGAAAATIALTPARLMAQRWRIELCLGSAYHFRTPLTIEQSGEPRLHFDAEYATRGFEVPLYYALRIERELAGAMWGLELVHNKLYLENPPPEVQRFNSTHGFNLLSVIRTSAGDGVRWRLGVGALLAHVENEIRGLRLPEDGGVEGYHLTGPVAHVGLGYRRSIVGQLGLILDARLVAGRARFPVVGGHARFATASAHFTAGLSQRF